MEKLYKSLEGLIQQGASKIYLLVSILCFGTAMLAMTTSVPFDNLTLAFGAAALGFWFAGEATDRERMERFWNEEKREKEPEPQRYYQLTMEPLVVYALFFGACGFARFCYVLVFG